MQVHRLIDGPILDNYCDTSLTGLSTCNLRSAWTLCTKLIDPFLSCGLPQICTIVLPAGSVTTLQGEALSFFSLNPTPDIVPSNCDVTISVISSSNLTQAEIQGDSSSNQFLTISAYSNTKLNFLNLIVSGFGDGSQNGGSINLINTNGVFENVSFDNNVGEKGGAIYISSSDSSLLFHGCTFSNNRAHRDNSLKEIQIYLGGAIYVASTYSGSMIFLKSTFSDNKADERGGALQIDGAVDGIFLIEGCVFSRNFAKISGAVDATTAGLGFLFVNGTDFDNNDATYNFGAVNAFGHSIFTYSSFYYNTLANEQGPGLF